MNVTPLLLALIPLAWLVPNHYMPWPSAWSDAVAFVFLCGAVLGSTAGAQIARPWAALCILALGAIGGQFLLGRIHFAGDALMAALYVTGFGFSIIAGGLLVRTASASNTGGVLQLALMVLVSAAMSVGVALVQWTGAANLGLWGVDMPPGSRPFGNVAQPNHFCTICFLGLCSLGLLHQHRRLGNAGSWVVAMWLMAGMVMSGSRTGWVQIALLAVFVLAGGQRFKVAMNRTSVVAMLGCFATAVLLWPSINEWLLMSEGRTLTESARSGTRPLHWAAMIDAIRAEPLWGYGWQQVSVAQVRGAETQPWVGEMIEHSHNLLLDLMVWNGIPLGLLLGGLGLWWYLSRLARCSDATIMWLLASVGGLSVHASLEFPLEYAYFLIPMGVWIGAVDGLKPPLRSIRIGSGQLRIGMVLYACMLLLVASDYLKAEQGHRLLRLESARIGVSQITTPMPDLALLTQLLAFQSLAQTEARPGMTDAQVDWMRKVSERYGYPPVMFRYALAAGLNGRKSEAALTLIRLCRIHPKERCDEARNAWPDLRRRYPELNAVPMP